MKPQTKAVEVELEHLTHHVVIDEDLVKYVSCNNRFVIGDGLTPFGRSTAGYSTLLSMRATSSSW
jgi:hypothetical protein